MGLLTLLFLSPVDCEVRKETFNDTSRCFSQCEPWQYKEITSITNGAHGGRDDCGLEQTTILSEGKCNSPACFTPTTSPTTSSGPVSCRADYNQRYCKAKKNLQKNQLTNRSPQILKILRIPKILQIPQQMMAMVGWSDHWCSSFSSSSAPLFSSWGGSGRRPRSYHSSLAFDQGCNDRRR